MLVKNIEKKIRLSLLTVAINTIACVSIVIFTLLYAFKQIELQREKIYILDNGVPLLAINKYQKETRNIEYESHINLFHRYFYTLVPDDKQIKDNLNAAMYLIDETGMGEYKSMKEIGYYNQLISQSIISTISIDSVVINDDMSFDYYGTQTIDRKTLTTKRSFHSKGMIKDIPRSKNNPHGVLITNWRVVENNDISNKNKRNF